MSERPVHGQDEHFDELLAGRVVTEAMTQFPEGTPLMEVLEWLHERLSLSETGAHVVAGMSMDAEYFQPTFPIDAVKREVFPDTFTMNARFPIAPIDPEFIPMTAWLTGYNTVDALLVQKLAHGKGHIEHTGDGHYFSYVGTQKLCMLLGPLQHHHCDVVVEFAHNYTYIHFYSSFYYNDPYSSVGFSFPAFNRACILKALP